jgi:hypothetical protein
VYQRMEIVAHKLDGGTISSTVRNKRSFVDQGAAVEITWGRVDPDFDSGLTCVTAAVLGTSIIAQVLLRLKSSLMKCYGLHSGAM